MKKLYRRGTSVHPSPPTISDHLSLLPAALLTLAAALTQQDREVLAYLISCSTNNSNNIKKPSSTCKDHPPSFNCDCFNCYMNYWAIWDSSPKRQLIHEILDAIENDTTTLKKAKKTKKDRKKRGSCNRKNESCDVSEKSSGIVTASRTCMQELVNESEQQNPIVVETCGDEDGLEKGSVRKFVSFIGDKIWGVWGQGK